MRRKLLEALCLALLFVSLLGCEARTDKTDGGGVLLSVTDFDGLPLGGSVNILLAPPPEGLGGFLQLEEIVLENVPKDPNGVVSDLMNIEIRSYEVSFTRADTGTRVPPSLVSGLFGVVPVGGTTTYNNLPLMNVDQTGNPPLSDLLLSNGAVDSETGSDRIQLNVHIRFFGQTLSGDSVQSEPASFLMTFFP